MYIMEICRELEKSLLGAMSALQSDASNRVNYVNANIGHALNLLRGAVILPPKAMSYELIGDLIPFKKLQIKIERGGWIKPIIAETFADFVIAVVRTCHNSNPDKFVIRSISRLQMQYQINIGIHTKLPDSLSSVLRDAGILKYRSNTHPGSQSALILGEKGREILRRIGEIA
jgi:hypothetical protein